MSPCDPSSADSSFAQNFATSPICPLNLMSSSPLSMTSPLSSSSSMTSSSLNSNNSLLSDFDIDLPEMIDDVDFAINEQEMTSLRAIVEQTFNDGRDVLDIISAVYWFIFQSSSFPGISFDHSSRRTKTSAYCWQHNFIISLVHRPLL